MAKRTPPLKRNDEIELLIDALGSEGQGVGRYDGFAVFVPFALPGERVRVHIIKSTASYAVGKLLSILTQSPARAVPACTAFGRCGGCSLMHLSYGAQLDFKQEQVRSALARIGGFALPEVLPALGMEEPLPYRNKGSFPFGEIDGRIAFGFFAPRSHRLIPISDCALQQAETLLVAETVCRWANEHSVSVYDESTHTGTLRHVMARVSEKSGEVMAVIVTKGKLPHKEPLVALLRERVPGLAGVIHNRNDAATNVIFGGGFETLWGSSQIRDTICGLNFQVSAASFLQVNARQTEALYGAAVEALRLSGTERVLDVYCGIGTISLLLAKHAGEVVGIESVPEAIEDAKKNALRNGIENARFLCGNAEAVLPKLIQGGFRPDAAVIDPPRKGCEQPVLDALIACGVPKLVYVSCNPATLARDAKRLAEGGFKLIYAQPVDMFPETGHVETIVLLQRETL